MSQSKKKQIKSAKNKLILCTLLVCMLLGCVLTGCNKAPVISYASNIEFDKANLDTVPNNPYFDLKVPTYITKIDGLYFIVDCYNNQVIYNENLEEPLCYWSLMTDDIDMGHTIASDGVVYLIDDTERNRILVMEKDKNANGDDIFVPTGEFNEIGTRPHYIIYNEEDKTFYAWSSMTGEMYLFRTNPDAANDTDDSNADSNSKDADDSKTNSESNNTGDSTIKENKKVFLSEIKKIDELDGFYVRSFTIIGTKIYFVSGNGNIIEAKLDDFEITNHFKVPDELFGMVQLEKIEDYYYITVSTDILANQDAATIIRTRDLAGLVNGEYEDVYDNFIGGGTPYSITKIDDDYYLCEHRIPGHSIWKFSVKDNEITDVKTLY